MAGYDNVCALDLTISGSSKHGQAPERSDLLRALLRLLLEARHLGERLQQTPLGERELFAAGRNFTLLLRELGLD